MIAPGSKLGPYEVVSPLGAGGMGEVYRARDTRLGRDVAIKVLPSELAQDRERLARFEREAKLLASLNHSKIAHVYGFESTKLPDGSTVHFLAMELVEGEDLAERLKRGAVPVDEAIGFAKQIAEGLEEAHEKGIVHRDLKPANIKLTADGEVKVLDFGLAKAWTGDGAGGTSSADVSHSPTMTRGTEAGMILGTAAYMSPEQARGKAVDKRADIWSFGVVLFEMLAGRPLFGDETVSDTLAAVLMREIDWKTLPARTPPAVERLLRRCLERDPRLRLRDIGEARILVSGSTALDENGPSSASQSPPPSRRSTRALAAGALVLIAIASGITWRLTHVGPAASSDMPIEPDIIAVTTDSGLTTEPAVSANGALLAYASDRGSDVLNIWVQPLPSGQPVQVTHDEAGAHSPNFSPDGSRIVYRSERAGGGIYVVPALGGPERLIAPKGHTPRFSPDGRRLAYVTGGRGSSFEVWIYSEDSGTSAKCVTTFRVVGEPVWLPDGAALCMGGVLLGPDGNSDDASADWYRVDVATGASSRMDADPAFKAAGLRRSSSPDLWLKDVVIFAQGAGDSTGLWSAGVSKDGRKIAGPIRRLTAGSGLDASPTVAAGSAGRHLYFASLDRRTNLYRLPIAANAGRATGELQPITDTASADEWPSLSQDGRTIVFMSGSTSSRDVWQMHLGAPVGTPLGTGGVSPTVSPDGQRAVYHTNVQGKGAWSIRPLAGGDAQVVAGDLWIVWDWPRASLLITGGEGKDSYKLFALDLATGTRRRLLTGDTSELYGHGRLSPDGGWMSAMEWTSAGRSRVIVFPFGDAPAPPGQWVVVSDEDSVAEESGWSPDGKLLYFVSERDGSRCLWVRRLDPRTRQPIAPPTAVLHLHGSRRSMVSTRAEPARFAVGPESLIFSIDLQRGNIWRATLREAGR